MICLFARPKSPGRIRFRFGIFPAWVFHIYDAPPSFSPASELLPRIKLGYSACSSEWETVKSDSLFLRNRSRLEGNRSTQNSCSTQEARSACRLSISLRSRSRQLWTSICYRWTQQLPGYRRFGPCPLAIPSEPPTCGYLVSPTAAMKMRNHDD